MSATLKQGKLGFASAKRTTSSSKIGKPNTITSTTLKPTLKEISSIKSKILEDESHDEILLASSDDDTPEEFDDIEAVSAKSDVETTRREDEEEIEDAPTPPPVERTTRSSTKKALSKNASKAEGGPSTEAAKVGVFRVSNARPEDVAKKVEANARKEDEGDTPELNHKDPKWRKHHNEVKEKMGHMHTSE
jgi:DNA polymerase delta subunit 4